MCIRDREYTEDTKTSVFFGTNEIPLELNGIKYTGEATLPLSEDYAGNVTFLFVDGNKRSTEVLDEFEGVTSVFKNVASGILANKPTFDNGSIKPVSYTHLCSITVCMAITFRCSCSYR